MPVDRKISITDRHPHMDRRSLTVASIDRRSSINGVLYWAQAVVNLADAREANRQQQQVTYATNPHEECLLRYKAGECETPDYCDRRGFVCVIVSKPHRIWRALAALPCRLRRAGDLWRRQHTTDQRLK